MNKVILSIHKFFQPYFQANIFKIWLFGFSSGLTVLLSSNTLNFWLAKTGINTKTIGLFSLVALPYSLKYLFAAFVDRVKIPILTVNLGRRKAWIFFSQIIIIFLLILLGKVNPEQHLPVIAILSFLIALFAVIQDIALDGYRIESLDQHNKGPASAIYILGYRLGMLTSGGGAIYLSYYLSWNLVYNIIAFILFLIMVLILRTKETIIILKPINNNLDNLNKSIYSKIILSFNKIFIKPFEKIGGKTYFILIILFIMFYRLPENIMHLMSNIFYLQLGFNELEIASSVKLFGFIMSLIGGLISGYIISILNIYNCLIIFGILHIITPLLCIIQFNLGYNISFLYILVAVGHIIGSMTMTAYIAYITNLCHGYYSATQYAFFASIIGISRVIIPSFSGFAVKILNWPLFFLCVSILSLPNLIIIKYLRKLDLNTKDNH